MGDSDAGKRDRRDPRTLDADEFFDAYARKPYTVIERTEPCGKEACACTDEPDAEHGPYRYHVYTEPDGSRRWEYQGPAYEL